MEVIRNLNNVTCPNCGYTGTMDLTKTNKINLGASSVIHLVVFLANPLFYILCGFLLVIIVIWAINFFIKKEIAICPKCHTKLNA